MPKFRLKDFYSLKPKIPIETNLSLKLEREKPMLKSLFILHLLHQQKANTFASNQA